METLNNSDIHQAVIPFHRRQCLSSFHLSIPVTKEVWPPRERQLGKTTVYCEMYMFKTSLLRNEIIALCVTVKTTEELSNECAAVDIERIKRYWQPFVLTGVYSMSVCLPTTAAEWRDILRLKHNVYLFMTNVHKTYNMSFCFCNIESRNMYVLSLDSFVVFDWNDKPCSITSASFLFWIIL